ncbi:MAG: FAD-dependent 5-carboxymethylaminomethyl-2-thiouridine(34) oxidoreductase MnmC [Limnohabitans sp.]
MARQQHGHVLQTGFGHGLDFLQAWHAWQHTPERPECLFVTALTEQAPSPTDILNAASAALQPLAAQLAAACRGLLPGVHRLVLAGGQVQLTLCIGPTDKLLRELDVCADSVLLSGDLFTPYNRLHLLQAVSRLCRRGTRVHLSAKAGPSADEWAQCGFVLDENLQSATYAPTWAPRSRVRQAPTPQRREALVLGAGLSGSAVAHSLALRGWSVTVLDQGDAVGAGASGLLAGLAAPHVSPDDSVLSRITRAGVRATLQRARQCLESGTDWALTGVLEHRVEGKRSLPSGDAWPPEGHEWSTHADAHQVGQAGLAKGSPALWHALAGWLRPRQLVAAQLQTPGVTVKWQQSVQSVAREGDAWVVRDANGNALGKAPLLVIACAFEGLSLLQTLPGVTIPLNPLRGQISYGLVDALTGAQREHLPPFPVNGHGSFIHGVPTPDGPAGWYIGSTFERNCVQAPVRTEDHAANQQRLATLLPDLGEAMASQFGPKHVHGWAGLRCTLPDRLPAVGPVDRQGLPGLWISAGMGARGISLAVLCGELTAAWLENEPLPLAPSLAKHLAAERFIQHR